METVNVPEKTWHLWLARRGGLQGLNTDICKYTRKAFLGALLCLAVVAAAITIVTVFFTPLVIYFGHFFFPHHWTDLTVEKCKDVIIVYGILAVVLPILIKVMLNLEKKHEEKRQAKYRAIENGTWVDPKNMKGPNFLVLAYLSWKDKYCIKVTIGR